jgi:hypothetical protein
MTPLLQRLKQFVIAATLTAAVLVELRVAISACLLRVHTTEAALRAVRFTPADEAAYLQLANLDPSRRDMYLRKASEVNPRDPGPWLDRGFMAEVNDNANEAEQDFREAASLDLRSAPSWALTNFYFRHNDMANFYLWSDRYRKFARDHAAGLFRLEWSRTPDAAALLKHSSPLTCDELEGMATFLASRAAPSDVEQVDGLLVSCPGREAAGTVMAGVSQLLTNDHPQEAMLVWNGLHRNGAFHVAELNPVTGPILTNAEFSNQLDELGFNWHVNRTPGVDVRSHPQQRSATFSFDGSEPEAAILLFQPIVLIAGTTYRLNCRVESEGNDESGFGWRIVELSTGKTLDSSPGVSAEKKNPLTWTFQGPDSPRTLALAFTYVRPLGEVRNSGKVVLSDITLLPIYK